MKRELTVYKTDTIEFVHTRLLSNAIIYKLLDNGFERAKIKYKGKIILILKRDIKG